MSHFKLERKKSTQIDITLGVLYIHYINMEHFFPFDEWNIMNIHKKQLKRLKYFNVVFDATSFYLYQVSKNTTLSYYTKHLIHLSYYLNIP